MNIAILKNYIPIPASNVINSLKHAQGFFNLGHKVDVLTSTHFLEEIWKFKIKNIPMYYDIPNDINIRYFRGNLFDYFSSFTHGRYKISIYIHKSNPFRAFGKSVRRFPKFYNFLDPEIIISKYCIKNKIDFVFCRELLKAAYNNIINRIPTAIDVQAIMYPAIFKLLFIRNHKFFRGFITVADYLKQELIKIGFPEQKILVLENAVDLNRFEKITNNKKSIRKKLNLPLDKKIILYAGKLRSYMGINDILDAAKLLERNKDISFYFLGGVKKHVNIWINYAIRNKIKADINFLGIVPYKLIPYYLKAADVLLAPYSNETYSLNYMSPLKIFEYMASNTPIIATKAGRINELCSNNQFLLTNPDDPIDLSEKIEELIVNDILKNKLIKNAYTNVKKHTIKERCRKILEFIN